MAFTKRSQAALAIEPVEGVEKVLADADLVPVLDDPFPNAEMTFGSIRRNIARGSLSPMALMEGPRSGRIPLTMELAAAAALTPTTVPKWGTPMRACGYRQAALKRVGIAAVWGAGSSTFHGETFTADVSGATGRVFGAYYEGESLFLNYEVLTGAITGSDTEIVTSGGATIPLDTPGTLLNALGWHPVDVMLSQIFCGAVTSGPITAGSEILGGTSGARGRVEVDFAGNSNLRYELYIGSPSFVSGETITVVGGAASTTASASETQTQIPSLTVASLHEGLRKKALGARGNVSASFAPGGRGLLAFDFLGKGVEPEDAYNLTWPAGAQNARPPKVIGSNLLIDGTFVPFHGAIDWNAQNVLALRESSSDASASGYVSTRITGRDHQVRLDMETVRKTIWPIYGNAFGKTPFRARYRIGLSGGDGNTFEFQWRHLQIDQSREQDGQGYLRSALTLMATAPDGSAGGDETVIIAY